VRDASALDDPVASLEFEKADGVQLFQGEAADELNDFGRLVTPASDLPPQPADGLNSGKAHLLWADILANDHPDFESSPVVLPGHGVGVRGGLRGKTLFGERRRERFKEALLVLLDRQQVIAALIIKNLLGRLH
jgi:hypothetical protein